MRNYAIAIARIPSIQIYESLTELLNLIAQMSEKMEIICPLSNFENEPLWSSPGVKYSFVRPKSKKLGIPTTLKLFALFLLKTLKKHPNILIGVDRTGNIMAAFVHKLFNIPFVYYGLELPCLSGPNMTWLDKMEIWSIRAADIVVTMDEHHIKFICKQSGINRDQCVILPNAASEPPSNLKNDLLRKRFSIRDSHTLLLHAGGIGAAQQSLELANMAREWDNHYHLVFHAHCRMDGDDYFQRVAHSIKESKNVHLNNEPVSKEALDNIVQSAEIGIACYDHSLLGYRAELLGLAAGKIGRYLKNGVPVIVTNLSTIKEYIDNYECGICVDRLEDIIMAIDKILKDYKRYSQNASRCYEELWKPDRYLIEIQRRIENILHHQ